MRVKCLAQEHNVVPWLGLKPRPLDPESGALTIRPLHLPLIHTNHCFLLFCPGIGSFTIVDGQKVSGEDVGNK